MSFATRLCAKAKSASVVMCARATAEAAEAILTKFLRETRFPFGSASVSSLIAGSPHKFAARRRTRTAPRANFTVICRIHYPQLPALELSFQVSTVCHLLPPSNFTVAASQTNVFDESQK